MKYNKDMTISEILFTNPKAIEIFKKYGLHCQRCFGAETETIEVVSRVKGIKLKDILSDLERLE